MTPDQLREMYADGWDIANHSWDHADLTTLTQQEVQNELTSARDWLVANQMPRGASDVAYPYAAYNSTVAAAMAETGMNSGRVVETGSDPLPLVDPYRVRCCEPRGGDLAWAKARVDDAVSRGSLVVFDFHNIWDTVVPGAVGEFATSDFRALIDYIATQPIAVVRMSDVTAGAFESNGSAVTADPDRAITSWTGPTATPPTRAPTRT